MFQEPESEGGEGVRRPRDGTAVPVGGRAEVGGEGQGAPMGTRAKGPALEERTQAPVSLGPMAQGDLLETWFFKSRPQTNSTYEFGPELAVRKLCSL